MPIIVNLRHLESNDVHLEGELAAEELDIESKDEVIAVKQPLSSICKSNNSKELYWRQGELGLLWIASAFVV